MSEYIVSVTDCGIMDVANNFMQFHIIMDIFFTVFDDVNFVFAAILIMIMLPVLFKLTSNYSIGYELS